MTKAPAKKLDVSYSSEPEQISPVGTRYTTRISKVFSDDSYIQALLDVEAANAQALSELYPQKVPRSSAAMIRRIASVKAVRPMEVRNAERRTHHEMAALISVMAAKAGKDGRYVHFGMTSADAVETAKAMQISEALSMLIESAAAARDAALRRAKDWRDITCISRTHGQHAIPTSFGFPFAFFGYCIQRSIERLEYDLSRHVEGKLSGAIGTYDVHSSEGIDGRRVERAVLSKLKVKSAEISLQTPPREGIAYIISDVAVLCGRLASVASYIKTLKRTEISELEEPQDEDTVGSSAMPHKSIRGNPFIEERCISIGRVVRSHASTALESISMEDLRDLSASLSDRIALPESFVLADYSCDLIANLMERVRPVRQSIDRNLGHFGGAIASQLVMSKLVEKGMQRSEARAIAEKHARQALSSGKAYASLLRADSKVSAMLSAEEIESLCNPESGIGTARESVDFIAKKYLNARRGTQSQ